MRWKHRIFNEINQLVGEDFYEGNDKFPCDQATFEYDDRGNLTRSATYDDWFEREYDAKNRVVHEVSFAASRYFDGNCGVVDTWFEYNDSGDVAHKWNSDGVDVRYEYQRDDFGNVVCEKQSECREGTFRGVYHQWFDESHKVIAHQYGNQPKTMHEYDSVGNLVCLRSERGHEEATYEYDEYGHKIHSCEVGSEKWFFYDCHDNCIAVAIGTYQAIYNNEQLKMVLDQCGIILSDKETCKSCFYSKKDLSQKLHQPLDSVIKSCEDVSKNDGKGSVTQDFGER